MQQPGKEDEQQDDGGGQNREDGGEQAGEEGVVLPGMAARLAEVARHEAVVAAVGFPRDVKEVAEEGDGADEDGEAEVDHHAEEGDVRDAANPCGEDEDGGGEAGEHIAETGDEADEAVDAEADGRAGNAEAVVEEMDEAGEVAVGEEEAGAGVETVCGLQSARELGAGGRGWERRKILRRGRCAHRCLRCAAVEIRCVRDVTIRSGMAAIVQWQNTGLWLRVSWVRPPLAAPNGLSDELSAGLRCAPHSEGPRTFSPA